MAHSLARHAPSHLPHGYRLSREIAGAQAVGFGDAEDQVALIYVRGDAFAAAISPLVVHVVEGDAPRALAATEGRDGIPVDLGNKDLEAVYHDGAWAPGAGPDERNAGDVTFHWDTSNVHSVTVRSPAVTVGVRGARDQGIDAPELIRVARSLSVAR